MREIVARGRRALTAIGARREMRLPALLFVWLAIFLVGSKLAYLAGLAEFWDGSLPQPWLPLRALAYQARELLIAFALCLALSAALRIARGRGVRRIAVGLAVSAALVIVVLNLVSAATLPVLGSPLTPAMIVYSDLLFSEHGRIAVASWVPSELLAALAACLVLAGLATWAMLASRLVLGLAVAGAIAATAAGALFLLTDPDHASVRKRSATATFLGSLRVFDEGATLGDVPPADPFEGAAVEPPVPLQRGVRGRVENIVLVVLESAGARYFDQYGGGYGITPELRRLAPQSLRGERVYANAASSYLAMITMLSGRQPAVSLAPPLPDTPMLPEILRREGLRTAFFHSSDTRAARAGDLLRSAGFGLVRDYRGRPCAAPLIADRSQFLSQGTLDRCTFAEMRHWIAAEPGKPFMAMLWTFQSHFDYFAEPDRPLPALADGEFAGDPRRAGNKARYLGALKAADEQIGELWSFLQETGLAESTLLIVTGDHGESFDDHGQFGHGGSLYESAVRVPLFLIHPGLAPDRKFDRLTSHIDLGPTILDLLGHPIPEAWDGTSLFRPRREQPVIFATPWTDLQVGYRLGNRKVVAYLLGQRASVYDLANDPGERRDLADGNRELQQAELARIKSWVRFLNAR